MASPLPAQTFFEVALLGMLACGFLAVQGSGELDTPTAVLMATALCTRVLMIVGVWRPQIPPALVTALAVGYLAFYPADYFWLSRSFVTATVHMIFFVAIAKLLTASTPRDYTYLKVIAGLELLAAAILSSDLNFFFYLTGFLLCAIGTFSSGEVLRSIRQGGTISSGGALPMRLTLLSSSLFCGILLLTVALFFVLPRTARAAFQRFVPQRYHLPGFGSEVTLGEIGVLKQNSAPVMHVRSYDDSPLVGLRWRGSALEHFDGKRWFNAPGSEERLPLRKAQLVLPALPRTRPARNLRYGVELSAIASDTLYFVGAPQTISIQAPALFRSSSGAIRAPRFGISNLRYGADSLLENEWASPLAPVPPLPEALRSALLELPKLDARIAPLARQWTAGESDPGAMARAVETHFHKDFGYSLQLLQSEVADPLAHFLFVRKQGHCEYFASSMAVMLRMLGIPSRVATGFLGGVYNPMSGWQVVRASDAHSWVEAWIPGRGWMTFDPTPSDPSAAQPGGWSMAWGKALLMLDAADQFWRDWVITYDFERQQAFAAQVQNTGRAWSQAWSWPNFTAFRSMDVQRPAWLGAAFVILFGVAAAIFTPKAWKWWARRKQLLRAQNGEATATDATLLYAVMLQHLARRGFEKPAWLTPIEFAGTLPPSELALLVGDLTTAYNQVRFGAQSEAAPRMARLLRRIEDAA